MKTFFTSLQLAILAFWHTLRGHPLNNAREAHQRAVRALYRAQADVHYHRQLVTYFNTQARGVDPHEDWHLFAHLKDQWRDHVDEEKLEQRRYDQAAARISASLARLQELENQPHG